MNEEPAIENEDTNGDSTEVNPVPATTAVRKQRRRPQQLKQQIERAPDLSLATLRTRTHYVPPLFATNFDNPLHALTHSFDVAVNISYDLDSVVGNLGKNRSLSKFGSLKRSLTASSGLNLDTAASKKALRAQQLRDCAEQLARQLQPTTDAFTTLVAHVGALHSQEHMHAVHCVAPYLLLDPSVTQREEFRRLRLCDNAFFAQIGMLTFTRHVVEFTLRDASTVEMAKERYNRVLLRADVWLLKMCNDSAALVDAVLPLVWRWDDEFQLLPEEMLQKRLEVCRKDLPMLIVGLLEVLHLTRERDDVIRSLYLMFV
jgi:hypothetical protein